MPPTLAVIQIQAGGGDDEELGGYEVEFGGEGEEARV